MPADEELPSTLERSEKHAQALWSKTHDSAVESYGEGERAHRTAFAALKHEYEKVGDHWERKPETGPSDGGGSDTAGGVDANATKDHLLDVAKRLDVRGRSRMTKHDLVEAIQDENDRRTRDAR